MSPEPGLPNTYHHYRALGDYGSARAGTHVFFFRNAKIYYGGQIEGSDDHGAFYLNGSQSPLGRQANADLVWDESKRSEYSEIDTGLFTRNDDDTADDAVCQPFLLQFEDKLGLRGNYISSDDLYFELGEYPYPLPTNAIMGMTFCTMSPAETETLLQLLSTDPRGSISYDDAPAVSLQGDPVPYDPAYDIGMAEDAHMESHLEAAVIANPSLLPSELQPSTSAVCRQVPICPFKPENLDRADVCYFDDSLKEGTVPDTIIELKMNGAGADAARQVKKYARWLNQRHSDIADDIDLIVYAPRFKRTFDNPEYIGEYAEKVTQWKFGEDAPLN